MLIWELPRIGCARVFPGLGLNINTVHFGLPVQSVIDGDTQVLVLVHYVHIPTQNPQRLLRGCLPPEVHHRLSGLGHVQNQGISTWPFHKATHYWPVLLFPSTYTPEPCRVIVHEVKRKGHRTVASRAPASLTTVSDGPVGQTGLPLR